MSNSTQIPEIRLRIARNEDRKGKATKSEMSDATTVSTQLPWPKGQRLPYAIQQSILLFATSEKMVQPLDDEDRKDDDHDENEHRDIEEEAARPETKKAHDKQCQDEVEEHSGHTTT